MSLDLLYEIVRRKRSFTMLVWFKERERIQGARKNFNPCLRITANLDRDHRIDVFASKASPSLRKLSTRDIIDRLTKFYKTREIDYPYETHKRDTKWFVEISDCACNIVQCRLFLTETNTHRGRAIVWISFFTLIPSLLRPFAVCWPKVFVSYTV